MSSFFSMTPDGSGLQVSHKFWIFWAFAIPITVIVVATFTLWIQRYEIKAVYKGLEKSLGKRKLTKRKPDLESGQTEKASVSAKS